MPTKRMFDLIVLTWLGMELAWNLPRLWAHRVAADNSEQGIKNVIAGTIESVG